MWLESFSLVRKGRGGTGGGSYRWVVCGEQSSAISNSGSLALLCGLWWGLFILSNSTLPPSPQPPTASLLSRVGRQKQLCTFVASAVPTAALHCGIPGVIKYLGGGCRPLYHGQKCHVLRFGFHWVLVHVSRKVWEKGNGSFTKLYGAIRSTVSLCSLYNDSFLVSC